MFDPFDLNKDGKLDMMEEYLKFQTIMGEDEDKNEDSGIGFSSGSGLSDIDDEDEDDEDELRDELEMYGLDFYDLEIMDEYDRREAIEAAGLDPDDYDDLFI